MSETDYISSAEAVRLFIEAGLSETTFRRKVREHPIQRKLPGGRVRGALYLRKDVEEAINQSSKEDGLKRGATIQAAKPQGVTDWIQTSDLPFVLAYDLEMYGIENTVDISITHAWWKKNPHMCRILFDQQDRRNIWGALTIMPLEEATIFKLLRGEIEERDITPDDILLYEDGKQYNGYVASATVKPEHRNYLRSLIQEMLDYWCDQYPRIQLNKLYAFAASDEGWNLISHLFFAPRYDLGPNAFELDLSRKNPSRLITAYQQCIKMKAAQKQVRTFDGLG